MVAALVPRLSPETAVALGLERNAHAGRRATHGIQALRLVKVDAPATLGDYLGAHLRKQEDGKREGSRTMETEALRIRVMDEGDLAVGMKLKDLAGWNQTVEDWRRFLALSPDGCFVAERTIAAGPKREGDLESIPHEAVGTAVACVFGPVGWIAMVLVDPAHRGHGIGTRLVERAIDYLEHRGVRSIRLDATPLGRPVYQKLGFRAEYELARWEGIAPDRGDESRTLRAEDSQLEAIARLDQQWTGTPRRRLIEHLFRQQPGAMRVVEGPDGLLGYATWREGARARFIGPAVAAVEEAGQWLVDAMLGACVGRRVFVDIPQDNPAATRWAQHCGFVVQRPLTRMVRGEAVADRPDRLWASSGPENG